VYELVTVDTAMQHAIHGGAGEHELERLARQSSPALFDDGLRLVAAGRTSLEEVLRVTRAG
jgi:general secretion pathway protein E